jgi:hypothetical protein
VTRRVAQRRGIGQGQGGEPRRVGSFFLRRVGYPQIQSAKVQLNPLRLHLPPGLNRC